MAANNIATDILLMVLPIPLMLRLACQGRLGRHVLDGVRVRAGVLCDVICADLIHCSVTVVSAVSLWKMMLAIDSHGGNACESALPSMDCAR